MKVSKERHEEVVLASLVCTFTYATVHNVDMEKVLEIAEGYYVRKS